MSDHYEYSNRLNMYDLDGEISRLTADNGATLVQSIDCRNCNGYGDVDLSMVLKNTNLNPFDRTRA